MNKDLLVNNYNPKFPIFEEFLKRGGIEYILKAIINRSNVPFLTKEQNEVWKKIMNELLKL